MYESFYGLRAKPFQLSPDPRFFYASRAHKRAFAYLRYGMRQGEGFIIVTGDVGIGKTTLAEMLFKALERANVVAAKLVSTQLAADDLLRMVAGAYGLPYEGVSKAELLRSLEAYFRARAQEGKRILLVVDEAQNLSAGAVEELRMLSNLHHQGQMLVQTFLLGQKEFRDIMRSEGFEPLRQRVTAAYHLNPLDPDETRAYVKHRLHTAGWQDDPRLAEDIYPEVHRLTGGVPRRINTLCDRLLLYGYLEELHVLERDRLLTVVADMQEERGDAWGAPAREGDRTAAAEIGSGRGNGAGGGAGSSEERLAAVEQAVATLTDAVRAEFAVLRRAIFERTRHRRDGEG
ncbi:MAG: AAA family ATPase [Gammaproteobacteria bacterium]|nr:AAA family ATPase [Gammaproteobacteria bacterium]NIR84450.1 AAA family ATPase [Gammaproteobacteria bacterium]NIR90931.1 AAA family ATPase [Gammaproteobacteria bacterium]NIU07117.1 AAA family ATPase [Gammaproteobacteria bacterium]NIV76246.1 AAA family ATPase [Gammaproteobacteria bacterium]